MKPTTYLDRDGRRIVVRVIGEGPVKAKNLDPFKNTEEAQIIFDGIVEQAKKLKREIKIWVKGSSVEIRDFDYIKMSLTTREYKIKTAHKKKQGFVVGVANTVVAIITN